MKKIVIGLLIGLLLGVGGYFGYDKFLKKETKKEEKTEVKTNESKEETEETEENINSNTVSDINENQDLKFFYYVSKKENTDVYRFSLTLAETETGRGFFSIQQLNKLEGGTFNGYYRIENNKLILSFLGLGDDANIGINLFQGDMKGNLVDDPDTNNENYKACIIDYNDSELQIGDYKLYKVN